MKDDIIKAYENIRHKRAQAEDLVKIFKEKERLLKADLLAALDANNLQSFSAAGYTVSRRAVVHAEVADVIKLGHAVLSMMQTAEAEGRPAFDGLLLTKAVSKQAILSYVKERLALADDPDPAAPAVKEACADIGVRLVETSDVSMRKSSR